MRIRFPSMGPSTVVPSSRDRLTCRLMEYRTTLIYALIDPRTGVTRYVGKTLNSLQRRLTGHVSEARSKRRCGKRLCYKDNWILQLVDNGLRPEIVLLETLEEGVDWIEREIYWIAQHQNLTNAALGGEGPNGYVMTEEHKAKLRGRRRSEETRRLISEARRNYTGWHHSEETRRKIGDAHRGRTKGPMSEETRTAISDATRGREFSQEHKNRISKGLKGRELPKESRQKVSRSLLKHDYPPDDILLSMAEVMSWAEISRQTGIPESSVRQRTKNIRERGW